MFLVKIPKPENKLTGAKYPYSQGDVLDKTTWAEHLKRWGSWSVLISPSCTSSINRGGGV